MPLVINDDESVSDPVASNTIYEIVMVVVCSGIMLVCGIIFILLVKNRHWNFCGLSYTEPVPMSTVHVNRHAHDNIATIDLQGPVHINYVNEKSKAPSEIPIGKVTLSRDALLYLSLITCLNLPVDMDSEQTS